MGLVLNKMLRDIKAVGFDLDQTLYPKNPEIDELIRNEIASKILEKKPELKYIQNVREIYDLKHKIKGSWVSILKEERFDNASEIFYECLSSVNKRVLELISRDEILVDIMNSLKKKYFLFLITNSPRDLSIITLTKIGIDLSLFDCALFGSDPGFLSKISGEPFKIFLSKSPYLPKEHVYVGDSLKADILPAKYCGMKTIAVGENINEADFSIRNIHDITSLLIET